MAGGTRAGLWRNGDFVRLWTASTVSIFGSLITRTALPFTAILLLHAGPIEIAILRSLELVAGLVLGLVAGAWVDRLRRRPIMIAADVGRAILLVSIPAAAVAGVLGIGQLFVIAFLAAVLTTFFEVADRAFLPSVVKRDELVAANAALTASASAAEFTAFGISGFLIQAFTAPVAIFVDAVSFVFSATVLGTIGRPESARPVATAREPMLDEIRAGLRLVGSNPVIRAIVGATAAAHASWGVFGVTYLLFATSVIGLGPAAIGVIAGVGGAGSFIGAVLAGRLTRRIGLGRALVGGMVLFLVGSAFIPLAPAGAVVLGAACLLTQQLVGDAGYTVYDIAEVSLRQTIVDDRSMGRVNGTMNFFTSLVQLAATIVGGILAEVLGLRAAMFVGLLGAVGAVAFLWFSPIRAILVAEPAPPARALLPGEELPLTE